MSINPLSSFIFNFFINSYPVACRGYELIKDIERYLERRIQFYARHTDDDEIYQPIIFLYEEKLESIELRKGCCTLKNSSSVSQNFYFDYFVGADGTKHNAATILATNNQN